MPKASTLPTQARSKDPWGRRNKTDFPLLITRWSTGFLVWSLVIPFPFFLYISTVICGLSYFKGLQPRAVAYPHTSSRMASYQPHHQQNIRRTDPRNSVISLESSWLVTEIARATNQNVFSDTLSSPLSDTGQSALPESEYSAELVTLDWTRLT